MRRSEREFADRGAIEAILRDAQVVTLGLSDAGCPYVVPMNFGYADGCLYLHAAPAGRKIDLLRRDPRVAFTVVAEQRVVPGPVGCRWSSAYRSVMGTGTASFVEGRAEKIAALDRLLGKFAPGPFQYDPERLDQTAVIRVAIESMTGKQAGL